MRKVMAAALLTHLDQRPSAPTRGGQPICVPQCLLLVEENSLALSLGSIAKVLVLLGGSSGGQSKSTSGLGQKGESHMLLGKHGLGAWPHLFWLSFLSPVLERLPWNTVRSSPPSSS